MTFNELLNKTNLTEDQLKEHLVLLALNYLNWHSIPDPAEGLVKDCTKYYAGFYKDE